MVLVKRCQALIGIVLTSLISPWLRVKILVVPMRPEEPCSLHLFVEAKTTQIHEKEPLIQIFNITLKKHHSDLGWRTIVLDNSRNSITLMTASKTLLTCQTLFTNNKTKTWWISSERRRSNSNLSSKRNQRSINRHIMRMKMRLTCKLKLIDTSRRRIV